MVSIMLKVVQTTNNGWVIEFPLEYKSINPIQKLDLLQDCIYEIHNEFKHVNETF